ncbi:MAG: hypothetical protein N2246_11445 [Candidatus Sumerlaeia bacterium]|nr:hypothetical protein [Candidatus Sumerlaeia bacterium]
MIEFWYSSYIFLGLSLAIGFGVYLVYRELKRRRTERRKRSALKELEEQFLKRSGSDINDKKN